MALLQDFDKIKCPVLLTDFFLGNLPRGILSFGAWISRTIEFPLTFSATKLLEKVNLECTKTRFFSSKMQKFLRILRIYYCSNLPFNVIILFYCNLSSYPYL